jgi:hypothetical protein
MTICSCIKTCVTAVRLTGKNELQQGFWGSFQLAAARQASAGEPVYDPHDSAVISVNDSAVIGDDIKPVAVEGGDEQQSELN